MNKTWLILSRLRPGHTHTRYSDRYDEIDKQELLLSRNNRMVTETKPSMRIPGMHRQQFQALPNTALELIYVSYAAF